MESRGGSELWMCYYHGTSRNVALALASNPVLDPAAAAEGRLWPQGPAGFYLASSLDTAAMFAAMRNNSRIFLEVQICTSARVRLLAAGACQHPVPQGAFPGCRLQQVFVMVAASRGRNDCNDDEGNRLISASATDGSPSSSSSRGESATTIARLEWSTTGR